jgi:hypothetical protein
VKAAGKKLRTTILPAKSADDTSFLSVLYNLKAGALEPVAIAIFIF